MPTLILSNLLENLPTFFLQIFDGPLETSPFVGRFCGTAIPAPYTSSTQDVYLKFKSDDAATGRGFRLTYTVACGGVYTGNTSDMRSDAIYVITCVHFTR